MAIFGTIKLVKHDGTVVTEELDSKWLAPEDTDSYIKYCEEGYGCTAVVSLFLNYYHIVPDIINTVLTCTDCGKEGHSACSDGISDRWLQRDCLHFGTFKEFTCMPKDGCPFCKDYNSNFLRA